MGSNGLVFDPAIDWFSKALAVGFAGAAVGGSYALTGYIVGGDD